MMLQNLSRHAETQQMEETVSRGYTGNFSGVFAAGEVPSEIQDDIRISEEMIFGKDITVDTTMEDGVGAEVELHDGTDPVDTDTVGKEVIDRSGWPSTFPDSSEEEDFDTYKETKEWNLKEERKEFAHCGRGGLKPTTPSATLYPGDVWMNPAPGNNRYATMSKGEHLCKECGKDFSTLKALSEHFRTHLLEMVCNFCKIVFRRVVSLNIHLTNAHKSTSLICHCGNSFSTVWELNLHLPIHFEQKMFQCDLCYMSFQSKLNLTRHWHMHAKVPGTENMGPILSDAINLANTRKALSLSTSVATPVTERPVNQQHQKTESCTVSHFVTQGKPAVDSQAVPLSAEVYKKVIDFANQNCIGQTKPLSEKDDHSYAIVMRHKAIKVGFLPNNIPKCAVGKKLRILVIRNVNSNEVNAADHENENTVNKGTLLEAIVEDREKNNDNNKAYLEVEGHEMNEDPETLNVDMRSHVKILSGKMDKAAEDEIKLSLETSGRRLRNRLKDDNATCMTDLEKRPNEVQATSSSALEQRAPSDHEAYVKSLGCYSNQAYGDHESYVKSFSRSPIKEHGPLGDHDAYVKIQRRNVKDAQNVSGETLTQFRKETDNTTVRPQTNNVHEVSKGDSGPNINLVSFKVETQLEEFPEEDVKPDPSTLVPPPPSLSVTGSFPEPQPPSLAIKEEDTPVPCLTNSELQGKNEGQNKTSMKNLNAASETESVLSDVLLSDGSEGDSSAKDDADFDPDELSGSLSDSSGNSSGSSYRPKTRLSKMRMKPAKLPQNEANSSSISQRLRPIRPALTPNNNSSTSPTEKDSLPLLQQSDRDSKCPYCGKAYIRTHYIFRHIQSCPNRRQEICSLCSLPFPSQASLIQHVSKSHNKLRMYACDLCKEVFPDVVIYNQHGCFSNKLTTVPQKLDTQGNDKMVKCALPVNISHQITAVQASPSTSTVFHLPTGAQVVASTATGTRSSVTATKDSVPGGLLRALGLENKTNVLLPTLQNAVISIVKPISESLVNLQNNNSSALPRPQINSPAAPLKLLSEDLPGQSEQPLKIIRLYVSKRKQISGGLHEQGKQQDKPTSLRKIIFRCRQCGVSSSHPSLNVVHRYLHRGRLAFRCQCGKAFVRRLHLLRHQVCHAESSSFICASCGQTFLGANRFARHKQTKMGPVKKKQSKKKQQQRTSECQTPFSCTCGHPFLKPAAYLWHKLKNSKLKSRSDKSTDR
ncbi:uncharacterized protein si:dkey-79d12.4 isoform X2 [Erpetoichthys calabaricus]|nr:uncharacterized protein si:dkey-79d12.4 isoform X2 [Erpetoichthys calabaricus]XP_028678256.2 uncharacterized protein si:dkey-79d12.4 isoform X2 [Erpetoichthys calabaricus]XP_051776456.1 uncharacterized protein si:dkey-79d12.4 isoform X2 [Erpetoichthys calabaricus]